MVSFGARCLIIQRYFRLESRLWKERLQATCKLYNVQWMDDPTNLDPTFALRNAIRSIVTVQENLPVALRKENIIVLARRGNQYRDDLLKRVNEAISKCRFSYEAFTGMLKAECPTSTYDLPERVLQHFIPSLIRVFKTRKLEQFFFHGVGIDKASKATVTKFLNQKRHSFNIQGTEFRRHRHFREDYFVLYLYPEKPRIRARRGTIVPINVPQGQLREWKNSEFEFPEQWQQFHEFIVKVKDDRKYYFRYFTEEKDTKGRRSDASLMKRFLKKNDAIKWNNAKLRSTYYPRCNLAVLCHKKKEVGKKEKESVDAIPQLRLNFSDGVFALCTGKYDLNTREHEWVSIKMEDEGGMETKRPRGVQYR